MGAHAPETERLLDGGGGGGGCCNATEIFWRILPGALGSLLALVIVVPMLYWPYQYSFDNGKHPEYSVAVAGFSGLDGLARAGAATLDPTFDLTVRIKEPRRWSAACVPRQTTAVVSYRGAPLATGPVPAFCARNENTTEVGSVMAWGTAVPVPQFARDRLAEELGRGDAAVDVKLMGPAIYCPRCDNNKQMVIECNARLGHGEASPPCSVRYQYPTLPDDPSKMPQQGRKLLRTPLHS